MRVAQRACLCLFVCLASALGLTALAARESSGVAVAVIQSADVDGATGKLVIQPEAPLYSGDRINTGAGGEVQVRFRDQTKLVVGPNSSLVIDAFVFNNNSTARQFSINAVRGAFRFITGNSVKDAYAITTPTATIGVRGTEFDLTVDPQGGDTYVAQIGGKTRICPRRRNGQDGENNKSGKKGCVEALPGCSIFSVGAGGDPRQLKTTADRNLAVRQRFRYIRNQKSLLADFRLDVSACGVFASSGSLNLLLPILPLVPLVIPPPVSP